MSGGHRGKREAGELKSTAKVHKKFDRTKFCSIKAVIRVLVWEIKVITEGIILVRARANSLFSTLTTMPSNFASLPTTTSASIKIMNTKFDCYICCICYICYLQL